ncbi:hypothetical protein [Haloarchaeobius sp. DFWS5]|uniref:hypothetical protein n=1 Tax=Haloarchaeobius sp. DFWS5 TaxID=3446114 RepID=UPI003EBDEC66
MTDKEREYRFLFELAWRTFLLGVVGFALSSVVLGNLPLVHIVSPDLPGALVNAGQLATLVVALGYATLRLLEYRAGESRIMPEKATADSDSRQPRSDPDPADDESTRAA